MKAGPHTGETAEELIDWANHLRERSTEAMTQAREAADKARQVIETAKRLQFDSRDRKEN